MATMRALQWRKIPVNLAELCLDTTLRCGQSFRYIYWAIWQRLVLNNFTGGRSPKTMSGLAHSMGEYSPYVKIRPTFTTGLRFPRAIRCP